LFKAPRHALTLAYPTPARPGLQLTVKMPWCKRHTVCTTCCTDWMVGCLGGLHAGPMNMKKGVRKRRKQVAPPMPSSGDLLTVPRLNDIVAQRIHATQHAQHAQGFGEHVSWRNGNHELFQLRHGPNYRCNGFKAVSAPPLYRCVGVDIVKSTQQIRQASRCLEGVQEVVGLGGEAFPKMILVNFQVLSILAMLLVSTHKKTLGVVYCSTSNSKPTHCRRMQGMRQLQ